MLIQPLRSSSNNRVLKNKNIKLFTGREVLLFLFFVMVSCCLWLMLTLNRDYEDDIKFKLSIKEVPEDISFSSADEELIVHIKDKGTNLMNYKFESFLPVSLPYSDFANKNGRLTLPASSLQKIIKNKLNSATVIMGMHPDTIVLYTQESAVKRPVALKVNVVPARQYALGDVKVYPDSVWVFASSAVTDTLKTVVAESLLRSDVRDTVRVTLPLKPLHNVNYNPAEVEVVIPVYPYTQKVLELPVVGIDFPEMYKLQTIPSKVSLQVNVSLENYASIQPEEFELGISYFDVYGAETNKAEVRVLRAPKGVKDVKIVPSLVEYIIEQR